MYDGEGALMGDWCGAPPSVWLELAALLFWLGPAAVMDAWAGWWSCISTVFLKVGCFGSLAMVGRIWVDGWWRGGYRWILAVVLHLGVDVGLVSSVGSSGWFSSLDHDGRQMLG
jgi:hypothetical protein